MARNRPFVADIRIWELDYLSRFLPRSGRVLDFGSGTGDQAAQLKRMGYEVEAVDVESSAYRNQTVFPVTFYDGRNLPFSGQAFDAIFSSNVLEHVRDVAGINRELQRVLKPGGVMVHAVPSAAWRFWTILSAFPAAPIRSAQMLFADQTPDGRTGLSARLYWAAKWLASPFALRRHGEWGNAITELHSFSRRAWRAYFKDNGYTIIHEGPVPLFYTGYSLFGRFLSLGSRHRLARLLGSACHVFVVNMAPDRSDVSHDQRNLIGDIG